MQLYTKYNESNGHVFYSDKNKIVCTIKIFLFETIIYCVWFNFIIIIMSYYLSLQWLVRHKVNVTKFVNTINMEDRIMAWKAKDLHMAGFHRNFGELQTFI